MEKHEFAENTQYQAQQSTSEHHQTKVQTSYQENLQPEELGNKNNQGKKTSQKALRLTIAAAAIAATIASSIVATGSGLTTAANLETTQINAHSIEYVAYLPENFENIEIILSNAKIKKTVKPTQQNFNGEFTMLQPETVYTLTVKNSNWQNTILHKQNYKTATVYSPPPTQDLSNGKITKITLERDYATKTIFFTFSYEDPNNFLKDFSAKLINEFGDIVLHLPIDKNNIDNLSISFNNITNGNYILEISAISTKNTDRETIFLQNKIRI